MKDLQLKPGDKVLIKYTKQHCYGYEEYTSGKITEVEVVSYRDKFINPYGTINNSINFLYNTFKYPDGKLISFSSDKNEDYIVEVLNKEIQYEIY